MFDITDSLSRAGSEAIYREMAEEQQRRYTGPMTYRDSGNLYIQTLFLNELAERFRWWFDSAERDLAPVDENGEAIPVEDWTEEQEAEFKVRSMVLEARKVTLLPVTDMQIAKVAGVPLKGTVKITRLNDSKHAFYSWNGTVYEETDSARRLEIIASEITQAYSRAALLYTDDLNQYIIRQTEEYKKAKKDQDNAFKTLRAQKPEIPENASDAKKAKLKDEHEKKINAQIEAARAALLLEYMPHEVITAQPRLGKIRQDYNVRENNKSYTGLRQQLRNELSVPIDTFDSNRYLVLENGALDLEAVKESGEVELLPHSPERTVTERHLVGTEWQEFPEMDLDDLSDVAPYLETYLRIIDEYDDEMKVKVSHREDMVNLFRATAAGLFSGQSMRCTPFLYGESGAGKGMFLRLMSELFPGHVATGGRGVFTTGKDSNEYAGGDVIRHRLVFNDEMKDVALDQDAYKDWSGGSKVRVLHKYRDSEEVLFQGIITTVLNTPTAYNPIVKLVDDPGMRSRYFPIYFPRGEAESGISIAELQNRIFSEELPQVLYFMVKLWLEWEAGNTPAIVQRTGHQDALMYDNMAGDDRIEGIILAGIDDKAWERVSGGTEVKAKDLMKFTEFFKIYDAYYKLYYKEQALKNTVLSEMRAKGLITSYKNSNRVVGLMAGGEWSRLLAGMEAEAEGF